MDVDQRADLLGLLEDLVEHAVLHAEIIDHEDFEGGNAEIDGFLHGVQQVAVDVLHTHVESIVDSSLGSAQGVSALDGVHHVLVKVLQNIVEDGGGAAAGGGPGAGEVAVSGDGAAKGHGQVSMGVDSAGQDQLAGGVHHIGAAVGGQIRADGGDLAVLHRKVRLKHFRGSDDRTVLND